MNWDKVEALWKQRTEKAAQWGKVMNGELAAKYEGHVGRLQAKYSLAKEEAKQEVDEFRKTFGN